MPNPDEILDVSQHIVKNHSKVGLYIDVVHINSIMFLVGVSIHIGLVQCLCIRKKNPEKFFHAILLMIRDYRSRGISDVVSIGPDKAFDAIESEIKNEPYDVTLTTCDADRHVEYIERMISFVKEQIRTMRVVMPYKIIPKCMTIEMIHCVIILMNALRRKGSLDSILLPREIRTGEIQMSYYLHWTIYSRNSRGHQ